MLEDLCIFSTSSHSTGFNSFINASFKTSSTFFTGNILISFDIFSGNSAKSFSLSFGTKAILTPAYLAPCNFSSKPPILVTNHQW